MTDEQARRLEQVAEGEARCQLQTVSGAKLSFLQQPHGVHGDCRGDLDNQEVVKVEAQGGERTIALLAREGALTAASAEGGGNSATERREIAGIPPASSR